MGGGERIDDIHCSHRDDYSCLHSLEEREEVDIPAADGPRGTVLSRDVLEADVLEKEFDITGMYCILINTSHLRRCTVLYLIPHFF